MGPIRIKKKALTVSQVAALCGEGRGTVNYWIRSKKLHAGRIGRNYSIPVEELLFFLKSTGQKIPTELVDLKHQGPYFRNIQNCWQYWQEIDHGQNCKGCLVFKNQLNVCFIAKETKINRCIKACTECKYYQEYYLPRIQFIHQMDLPAAVYKDLYIWGGNRKFAELCEVEEKDLVGMGIEHVVHPDSMETVISNAKRRALGDLDVPRIYNVFLKNTQKGKIEVRIGVCSLNEPARANFLFAEQKKE